ncbi:MAG TPA: hypothetical protein VMK12_20640 [Anaeromyxobacteraceae bacterium]|nr:hypothetical protein [Anaeromyxobacteraceae bacterium]
MRNLLVTMLVVTPLAAAAASPDSSVSNEVGVADGQSDPRTPRAGQVTETITGSVTVDRRWVLDMSAGLTATQSTKGAARKVFGSEGGTAVFFSPGITFEANDHFNFGVMGSYSPSSELRADTTVVYQPRAGRTQAADAQVSAITSSWSTFALVSYQTAGVSDWETTLDLDGGITHYDSEQRLVAARDPQGLPLGLEQLKADVRMFCVTAKCSRQLLNLFRENETPLNQVTVRLGATETVHVDTDLGVHASFYIYDRDPTDVGFYGLMATGRGTSFFQSGLPLAPLQWSVRPEITHRFDDLSARLWFEHGQYVDSEGTMDTIGLKLQYKVTRGLRVWLTASLQRDEDAVGDATLFGQGTVGAMLLF